MKLSDLTLPTALLTDNGKVGVNEERQHSFQDMILLAAKDLGYKQRKSLPTKKSPGIEAAYEQAVLLARLYDNDASQEANNLQARLGAFIKRAGSAAMSTAGEWEQNANVCAAVRNLAKLLQQTNEAIGVAQDMDMYLSEISDFMDFLTGEMAYSEDRYNKSIATAVCKQLGIPTV